MRPAETLGSLGSALHAGLERVTVGIEISATHHRAASAGLVTGIASLLHGGRTTTTYEVVISDEAGRRVCTSRLTCLLMDRVPGKGGPGRGDRPHPPTVTGRRPPVVTAVTFRATAHPVRHKANHSTKGRLRHSDRGMSMPLRRAATGRYGGAKDPGEAE